MPLLELRDQVDHLGLDRGVEPGGRLVEDQQARVGRESHRDHDALLHPAGKLVRVAPEHRLRVGDANLPERGDRALARLGAPCIAEGEDFLDLPSDPERRVQRAAGVLVDHRDHVAAIEPELLGAEAEDVPAGDLERAGRHPPVSRQVAHDRVRHGRLAAAGLADEPVARLLLHREGDAAHDLPVPTAHAVDDLEVAKREGGGGRNGGRRAHSSSTC